MKDLYLKFQDEAQAEQVLYDFIEHHVNEEGIDVPPDQEGNYPEGTVVKTDKRNKFLNTDVIGTIYKPTGATQTVEGMEVPVMEALEGYHVNVRLVDEDESTLTPYAIQPANPVRVWF